MAQDKIKQIEHILRTEFLFSEEDIKNTTQKIVEKSKEKLVENLSTCLSRFVGLGSNVEERKQFGKKVVSTIFNFFSKGNERICDGFFDMMREAKRIGMRPYALAIETNFKEASVFAFKQSMKALTEKEYDKFTESGKEKLFSIEQVKELFERSASIACKLTEENVQSVMDEIAMLGFDEQTDKFVISPKELIRKAPSLLLFSAESIAKRIEFLEENYVKTGQMTQLELAKRVEQSPSLLMISISKPAALEKALASGLLAISLKTGVDYDFDAVAHEFCFNIDNLNTISTLNKDNMTEKAVENIAKTLADFLGADNAVKCLTNHGYFLQYSPSFLAGLLEKVCKEEQRTGKPLRKFLVEHSASALAMFDGSSFNPNSQSNKASKTRTQVHASALPTVTPTGKLSCLTGREKSEIEKLVEAIKSSVEKEKAPKPQPEEKVVPPFVFTEELEKQLAKKNKPNKHPYLVVLERAECAYNAKFGEGSAERDLKTRTVHLIFDEFQKILSGVDLNRLKTFCGQLDSIYAMFSECSVGATKNCEKFIDETFRAEKTFAALVENAVSVTKSLKKLNKRFADVPSTKKFIDENFINSIFAIHQIDAQTGKDSRFFDPNLYAELFFTSYIDNLGIEMQKAFGEDFEKVLPEDVVKPCMQQGYDVNRHIINQYGCLAKMKAFADASKQKIDNFSVARSGLIPGLVGDREFHTIADEVLHNVSDFLHFMDKGITNFTCTKFQNIKYNNSYAYLLLDDEKVMELGCKGLTDEVAKKMGLKQVNVEDILGKRIFSMDMSTAKGLIKDDYAEPQNKLGGLKRD